MFVSQHNEFAPAQPGKLCAHCGAALAEGSFTCEVCQMPVIAGMFDEFPVEAQFDFSQQSPRAPDGEDSQFDRAQLYGSVVTQFPSVYPIYPDAYVKKKHADSLLLRKEALITSGVSNGLIIVSPVIVDALGLMRKISGIFLLFGIYMVVNILYGIWVHGRNRLSLAKEVRERKMRFISNIFICGVIIIGIYGDGKMAYFGRFFWPALIIWFIIYIAMILFFVYRKTLLRRVGRLRKYQL